MRGAFEIGGFFDVPSLAAFLLGNERERRLRSRRDPASGMIAT
jgi:hypothetical protein